MYHINIYQNTSSYPDIRIYILFCKIVIAWFCPFVSHIFVVQKWQWSKTQVSLVLCFDSPVIFPAQKIPFLSLLPLWDSSVGAQQKCLGENCKKYSLSNWRKKSDLCLCHPGQQLAPDVDLRMMPIVSEVEYRGWSPYHLVGRRNSANIGYNQFIQD